MTLAAADHIPTSAIIGDLLKDAPGDRVTLDWLLGNLGERSFGIVLLVLGLLGLVPGVSIFTALLLLVPAVQMMLARGGPDLPDFVGARRLPVTTIGWLLQRATPSLMWLERFTHPRWQTPLRGTTRIVGAVILLLALSGLSPIPFASVIPNLAIMLIAFAILEKDGVVLAVAMGLALASLAITAGSIWVGFVVPRYL